jgi:hypothetical protein
LNPPKADKPAGQEVFNRVKFCVNLLEIGGDELKMVSVCESFLN